MATLTHVVFYTTYFKYAGETHVIDVNWLAETKTDPEPLKQCVQFLATEGVVIPIAKQIFCKLFISK